MARRRVGWRRSPPRWLACLPLLLVLDAKVLHVLPQHTCRPYDVLQNANQKNRYEKGDGAFCNQAQAREACQRAGCKFASKADLEDAYYPNRWGNSSHHGICIYGYTSSDVNTMWYWLPPSAGNKANCGSGFTRAPEGMGCGQAYCSDCPADLNVCSPRAPPPLQPPALPPAPPVSPPRYAIFAEPPLQYMQGVRDCEARGGLMAAPLGVAANAELAAMLRARAHGTHMYIGVTDRNGKSVEGTFVLESTEEPIDASWPDGLPWASEPNQQPNNLRPNQGGQDCLVLDVNGTWGDAFCSDRLPYACEFLPSPPPAPPAAPPLQCPTSMTQWGSGWCDLPGNAGHEWCQEHGQSGYSWCAFPATHTHTREEALPCAPRRACSSSSCAPRQGGCLLRVVGASALAWADVPLGGGGV